MRLGTFLSGFGLASSAALAGACLPDLPDARKCPPDPAVSSSSCLEALNGATPEACLADQTSVFTCLTGPRPNCNCLGPQECPTEANSCFPPGDCPPAVTDRAGGNASCIRLAASDINAQCTCGCADCISVCDGRGPVFGTVIPQGGQPLPLLRLGVDSHMPESGKIGVYLRFRGIPADLVAIQRANQPAATPPVAQYPVASAPDSNFQEEVYYDSTVGSGPVPYAWQSAEERPVEVQLVAQPPNGPMPQSVSLIEVDCVIPFVVP